MAECAGKDASYAYVSDGTNCEAMKPEDDDTNTVATQNTDPDTNKINGITLHYLSDDYTLSVQITCNEDQTTWGTSEMTKDGNSITITTSNAAGCPTISLSLIQGFF